MPLYFYNLNSSKLYNIKNHCNNLIFSLILKIQMYQICETDSDFLDLFVQALGYS